MTSPRPEPDAHRRAEALVTAWKQRVFRGAQCEPPDRWLMKHVTAALQAEAARARAEEREECARIADRYIAIGTIPVDTGTIWRSHTGEQIAAAIRARGAGRAA